MLGFANLGPSIFFVFLLQLCQTWSVCYKILDKVRQSYSKKLKIPMDPSSRRKAWPPSVLILRGLCYRYTRHVTGKESEFGQVSVNHIVKRTSQVNCPPKTQTEIQTQFKQTCAINCDFCCSVQFSRL